MNNGKLLININYNDNLLALAEKYLSIAESNPNDENKNDAYFFIQKLNSNLQNFYLNRYNAISSTGSTTTTTVYVPTTTITPTTTVYVPTTTTITPTTTVYVPTTTQFIGNSKIVVALGNLNYNSNSYTTLSGNTINFISWNSYENYDNWPLKDTYGNIKGYFVVKPSEYPVDSTIKLFTDSGGLNPVISGNTGVYPDSYIKYFEYPVASNVLGNKSLFRMKGFEAGEYTVKILSSEDNTVSEANRVKLFYQINSETPVNPASQTANNTTVFTTITDVTVTSDGLIDIYCYNTGGIWNEPGINLIEIIKQ